MSQHQEARLWLGVVYEKRTVIPWISRKPHIEGLDYSFSGVKTSLLYFVRDEMAKDPEFLEKNKEDLCASFQKTLIDILLDKLVKAAKQTGIKEVTIGGGVSANSGLRARIEAEGKKRGWNTYRYNITEVTYMVGMNDSRYFAKCFKNVYGYTPTEYKKNHKNKTDK